MDRTSILRCGSGFFSPAIRSARIRLVKRPGLSTIKTLFAHSCNRCAFPGCDQRLTDPTWNGVRADIAHIRGEKPGAARYAPDMTDDERNPIDNLMLLC